MAQQLGFMLLPGLLQSLGGLRFLTNDEIMFGGHAPYGSALAQTVRDRYPVGSPVSVIHDPTNPRHSALVAKATLAAPLGYGLPLLTAGLLFLGVWAGTP